MTAHDEGACWLPTGMFAVVMSGNGCGQSHNDSWALHVHVAWPPYDGSGPAIASRVCPVVTATRSALPATAHIGWPSVLLITVCAPARPVPGNRDIQYLHHPDALGPHGRHSREWHRLGLRQLLGAAAGLAAARGGRLARHLRRTPLLHTRQGAARVSAAGLGSHVAAGGGVPCGANDDRRARYKQCSASVMPAFLHLCAGPGNPPFQGVCVNNARCTTDHPGVVTVRPICCPLACGAVGGTINLSALARPTHLDSVERMLTICLWPSERIDNNDTATRSLRPLAATGRTAAATRHPAVLAWRHRAVPGALV